MDTQELLNLCISYLDNHLTQFLIIQDIVKANKKEIEFAENLINSEVEKVRKFTNLLIEGKKIL